MKISLSRMGCKMDNENPAPTWSLARGTWIGRRYDVTLLPLHLPITRSLDRLMLFTSLFLTYLSYHYLLLVLHLYSSITPPIFLIRQPVFRIFIPIPNKLLLVSDTLGAFLPTPRAPQLCPCLCEYRCYPTNSESLIHDK
jgi:hypothetical protein